MICKNCNHTFEGNFCNNCGQSAKIGRINFKYVLHDIPGSFFQLNRGLFYTIKELVIHPGHSIRDFIAGKRKGYYQPLAFFVLTSALYVLASLLLDQNTYIADGLAGFLQGMKEKNQTEDLEILDYIKEYQTYVNLLFVPVFSVASYLTFRKYDYNYFEHLVLNLYISGQQMIINLLFSFILFDSAIVMMIALIVIVVYNYWAFFQFFNQTKPFKKLVLVSLAYLIYIVEMLVLFILLGFIIGLISN